MGSILHAIMHETSIVLSGRDWLSVQSRPAVHQSDLDPYTHVIIQFQLASLSIRTVDGPRPLVQGGGLTIQTSAAIACNIAPRVWQKPLGAKPQHAHHVYVTTLAV